MNANDLSTEQIRTLLRFRDYFPDVKLWPSGEYGVALLHTSSAGIERVSRLHRDGTTSDVRELTHA